MIKALVFDFDGLILDTEGPIFQSYQELFHSYGHELTLEDWELSIGSAEGTAIVYKTLKQKFGGEVDLEAIDPQREERELELIAAQPILPGVRKYIKRARELGLKLGIASSSSCEWVMRHLEQRGLIESFHCVLAADDVQFTKPDPSLYLSVLEHLEVVAREVIAFEDSPNGVTAAKRAGIYCVAVPNEVTRELNLDHADLQLNSLEELSLDDLIARVEKERD